MAILMPALHRAREQGQRAACLSNLKQLTVAWIMYADENDNKIVNGYTGKAGEYNDPVRMKTAGSIGRATRTRRRKSCKSKPSGMGPCSRTAKTEPSSTNVPAGMRGEMRTYAIVDSMNGWPTQPQLMHQEQDGDYPAGRANRLSSMKAGSRSPVGASPMTGNPGGAPRRGVIRPPRQPQQRLPAGTTRGGTDFSLADGHSEYWKWQDRRTIDYGMMLAGTNPLQPGNPDLHRVQKAVWGKLGYTPVPENN